MEYPTLDTLVQALLAQGHKVEAVKQVHRATGWGLRASKDYVDALASGEDSPSLGVDPVDYTAFSAAALLAALEYAGRAPHPELIRACLARREALTPGLLVLLQAAEDADGEDVDRNWEEENSRWYRSIHAGLLLCAFCEPAALPIFARLLHDEAQDALHEWFDFALPYYYGPLAVPMLVEMQEGEVTPLQYDVVSVDEAQFFAPVWFDIVRRLVLPELGYLFLAADPTQGFLRRGESRRAMTGLEVRGRTHHLQLTITDVLASRIADVNPGGFFPLGNLVDDGLTFTLELDVTSAEVEWWSD